MSNRAIMMPDKIMRSGSAPVYNEHQEEIARIHYQYFSMTRKLEIKDPQGRLLSIGKTVPFSFRPKWVIQDRNGYETGVIKQLYTFLSRSYIYTNHYGVEYRIEGNLRARNFQMYQGSQKVIDVASVSDFFTLRPHSYLVTILDEKMDTYEVINVVEGIRSLVEMAKSSN